MFFIFILLAIAMLLVLLRFRRIGILVFILSILLSVLLYSHHATSVLKIDL